MSPSWNSSTLLDPLTGQPSFGVASNRLPVHLILLWGEGRSGDLFLREVPTRSRGVETVGTRLNDPETQFVPVSIHGSIELVRLGAVACVECHGDLPEVAQRIDEGARREPVAIELVTGEVIRGHILSDAPPERARLSDVLNQRESFFLVLCAGCSVYVNRDAVASVRPARGPSAVPKERR